MMAYIVDLIFVLRGLFDSTLAWKHRGHPSWEALNDAIGEYSGNALTPLEAVHDDIRSDVEKRASTFDREKMRLSMENLICARLGDHSIIQNSAGQDMDMS